MARVSSSVTAVSAQLADGRVESRRIIAEATEAAARVSADADRAAREEVGRRLDAAIEVREEVAATTGAIDDACARLSESMARVAGCLVEQAGRADWSAPPWPGGLDRTVAIRLSQTRQLTLRVADRDAA